MSYERRMVGVLPAGGWRVRWTFADGIEDQPLIGWALYQDGTIEPVTWSDGEVTSLTEVSSGDGIESGKWEIYHPDTIETATEAEGRRP